MPDDAETIRTRIAAKLERTAALEAELGRQGFEDLPQRTQTQLSLLQAQAEPKRDANTESLLGTEHNLEAYEAKLRDALDLIRQMQGERGRRQSAFRRKGRKALLVATVVALLLVGGAVFVTRELGTKAAACDGGPSCVQSGLCGATVTLKGSPGVVCAPRSDADCAASKDCAQSGRCRMVGEACGATSDADCATLDLCRSHGFCSEVNGSCAPAKVQDCRPTPGCTERGLCTPLDGVCKAGSDADCRQSELCQKSRACVEVAGECIRPPDDFGDAGAP